MAALIVIFGADIKVGILKASRNSFSNPAMTTKSKYRQELDFSSTILVYVREHPYAVTIVLSFLLLLCVAIGLNKAYAIGEEERYAVLKAKTVSVPVNFDDIPSGRFGRDDNH